MQAKSLSISGKTVDEIAENKVDAQTQEDIFNKLTKDGTLKGIYMKDGVLYVGADYINGGTLTLGTD